MVNSLQQLTNIYPPFNEYPGLLKVNQFFKNISRIDFSYYVWNTFEFELFQWTVQNRIFHRELLVILLRKRNTVYIRLAARLASPHPKLILAKLSDLIFI